MEESYDLMGAVLTSKANEHMIGFAGFVKSGTVPLEGVVKVSAFHRADSSGYLTLTFIIDREPACPTRPCGGWVNSIRMPCKRGSVPTSRC